jgi:hypothetical protein
MYRAGPGCENSNRIMMMMVMTWSQQVCAENL